MAFPESVVLCECWARDGLQSIPTVIPTDEKVEMLHRILDSGVQRLEVTSFSHPKLLPQFEDCEEVLRQIDRRDDVTYVVLMPNEKGWARFELCHERGFGADDIILMTSASQQHNRVNFRMSHDEAKRSHARIMKAAHSLGVRITGCTGTVYGCPIAGDVSMSDVIDITRFYLDEGAQTLMLGDTTGAANPLLVRDRIGELQALFPDAEFIAHFHDTRGNGIVNTITALQLGLRHVDSSLGAIGGQPSTGANKYQFGFTGNTCTEDLVCLLEEMSIGTGIDVEAVIANGHRAEEIVGQPLRANVIRSGPVNHSPRDYAPAAPQPDRARV